MNDIQWSDNPKRDARLLDWLDQHPLERNILFAKLKRGNNSLTGITKTKCHQEAAIGVFAVDEDPRACELATFDSNGRTPHIKTLADLIRNRLLSWGNKYQRTNDQLKRTRPSLRLEDISRLREADVSLMNVVVLADDSAKIDTVDGDHKHAKARYLTFSEIWERLHIYWCTLPHYNTYYPEPSLQQQASHNESTPLALSSTPAKQVLPEEALGALLQTRRNVRSSTLKNTDTQLAAEKDFAEVIAISDSETEDSGLQNAPANGPPVDDLISQTTRRSLKRKHEHVEIGSSSNITKITDSAFRLKDTTVSQSHERRLAELEVELKKLENEALEKKAAADLRRLELEAQIDERKRIAEHENQRAREKHELRMKMMDI